MALLGLDPGTRPAELGAWLERVHAKDVAAIRLAINNLLEGLASFFEVEHRVRYGDGYRWIRAAGRSIVDANGEVSAIAGSLREVAEPADTDRLTGLSSPASFVTGITRAAGDHQAILLLDVDGFGGMNRSLGQAHGDELLQAIARRLSAGARDTDSVTRPRTGEPDISVARLGGDEFAVLLNGLSNPDDASGVARRLAAHVGGAYTIGGQRLFVTVSSGLAVRPSAEVPPDAVLRNAQAALHRAKLAANGSLVVFDEAMHAEECERFQIVQDLRVAIEEDQFTLEYQPIIDITTGGIREVEALVRWDHPTRGRLSPAVFIPRAEESGLIVALGEAVLSKVCRQLRSWQDRGSPLKDLRVCVNVSPRQLAEPSICERFEAVLVESGVAASQIELEVTESSLMADPDRAAETLNRLRSAGFSLAIDDFGTGYSSLAYVRSFAVDRVKVDRAFLQEETPHVLETVVALSHRLGMTTVAEGVETRTHVEQMQRLSCDFGQGYFLHRPLPPGELEAVLGAVLSSPQSA